MSIHRRNLKDSPVVRGPDWERGFTIWMQKQNIVQARNLANGEEEVYSYDNLILAVGASPIVPDDAGMRLPGVFQMRTPQDAYAMRAYVEEHRVKRAVGGGRRILSALRLRRTFR